MIWADGNCFLKGSILKQALTRLSYWLPLALVLVPVDRAGRKSLLYVGVSGMTALLVLLPYSFRAPSAFGTVSGVVATIYLMVYIACFAFSMGPIAWILASEVFPLRVVAAVWRQRR